MQSISGAHAMYLCAPLQAAAVVLSYFACKINVVGRVLSWMDQGLKMVLYIIVLCVIR